MPCGNYFDMFDLICHYWNVWHLTPMVFVISWLSVLLFILKGSVAQDVVLITSNSFGPSLILQIPCQKESYRFRINKILLTNPFF